MVHGRATVASAAADGVVPLMWSIVGTGDFNGDGKRDILWRDTSGNTAIWFMDGTTVGSSSSLGNIPTTWSVVGTGDFNGDGMFDIPWQDSAGDTSVWLMNGAVATGISFGQIPTDWVAGLTGDFNGDGTSDILWFNSTFGVVAMWLMQSGQMSQSLGVGFVSGTWAVQNANAD
jgi:hypothetical protein